MDKFVVVNSNNTTKMNLHTSNSVDAQFELHQRIFVCWFYALIVMYHCLSGYSVRLLHDTKFINAKLSNTIKSSDVGRIHGYSSTHIEKLWSDVNSTVIRLLLTPIYGAYIFTHVILGTNINYIYSKDNGILSNDKYRKVDSDNIIVQDV